MLVIDIKKIKSIKAGDGSLLKELLHPKNDIDVHYSLAHAIVKPGKKTKLHKLKYSEAYFILQGKGEMQIENETKKVRKDHVVYIPPNSKQRIKNVGSEDLVFLCIVDPPWNANNDEILEK